MTAHRQTILLILAMLVVVAAACIVAVIQARIAEERIHHQAVETAKALAKEVKASAAGVAEELRGAVKIRVAQEERARTERAEILRHIQATTRPTTRPVP